MGIGGEWRKSQADPSMAKPNYRRVIVKLSGEALSGPERFGIHQPTIDRFAADLIAAHKLGIALGVVVGGGNTAVEEALFLTNFASQVTLVHRRDALRAEKILQDRLFRNPKIEIVWDSIVDDILGVPEPPMVTGVRLRNLRSGVVRELSCDGVFVAIGHTPVTGFLTGQLPLDPERYVITRPDSTQTAIPGVFAAGDVKDKVFRQAVTAAGMGCMAALEAEKFLAAQEEAVDARAAE